MHTLPHAPRPVIKVPPPGLSCVALATMRILRRYNQSWFWSSDILTGSQTCGKSGAAIRPRAMSDEFKALCAGCGVALSHGEACHILRHTHATQLLGDGENPEAVRERLGHTRIEMTYRYDHVMPGEGARVARRYGQVARRTRAAGSSR